jgi:hypothetical protein
MLTESMTMGTGDDLLASSTLASSTNIGLVEQVTAKAIMIYKVPRTAVLGIIAPH